MRCEGKTGKGTGLEMVSRESPQWRLLLKPQSEGSHEGPNARSAESLAKHMKGGKGKKNL